MRQRIPDGVWVLASRTLYLYDGNLVIRERDGNNFPTVSYTRGRDLSGSLQGAGGIGGLLAFSQIPTPSPRHSYYHADGNGNITMLIDSVQLAAAKYLYDPFGNTLSASGPVAEANLYRFSSKEQHISSSVLSYGYRRYQPFLQRWTNRDPIEEGGGLNLYAIVANDPINQVDPFGLQLAPPIVLALPPDCTRTCPCNVHCDNTEIEYGDGKYYGHNTFTYKCTDCNGNTWEETKKQNWINSIGPYSGHSGKRPPPYYDYTISVPCGQSA
jgi:RHS repeat-associated protein